MGMGNNVSAGFLTYGDGVAPDGDSDCGLKYFIDVLNAVQGARLHIIVEALSLDQPRDFPQGDLFIQLLLYPDRQMVNFCKSQPLHLFTTLIFKISHQE